jgi:hypothetical protein
MSSLFFSPIHPSTGPRVVRDPVTTDAAAVQVPITFHTLPPLNLMLGESWYFAVAEVGANPSRESTGGFAVPPLPWKYTASGGGGATSCGTETGEPL